jgi:hypothetical protein
MVFRNGDMVYQNDKGNVKKYEPVGKRKRSIVVGFREQVWNWYMIGKPGGNQVFYNEETSIWSRFGGSLHCPHFCAGNTGEPAGYYRSDQERNIGFVEKKSGTSG